MLRQCVNLHPDGLAFKFIDYDRDWDGVAESVTWYQLYRRMVNVARELRNCASPGDRVVILAPQSLDYIYAFLGALQAGLIAVPLSLPQGGATDERVDSVMQDASPTAILTTSTVIDDIAQQITPHPFEAALTTIEVDRIDLDASIPSDVEHDSRQTPVYLQYTSGSTRTPAGVMITYRNLLTNLQQLISGYFAHLGGIPPRDVFLVSWLPFYHDMGLVLGVCAPIMAGFPAVLTSPIAFLQRPARWIQLMSTKGQAFSAAPNFAFELAAGRTSDDDLAGYDLSHIGTILSGSERVHPTTLKRFTDRFARFNFQESALRPSYGLAEATVYVATSSLVNHPQSSTSTPMNCPPGRRSGARARAVHRWSVTTCRSHRRCGSSIPRPTPNAQTEGSARSGCTATTSPSATGTSPLRPSAPSGKARRSVGRHTRRTMAENRRFGLYFRGRTVHHRPHQGPADRLRAQPLSRRHRGDDPRDHPRPLRGDSGSG